MFTMSGDLDRSMLAEYQERLASKQREVSQLQQQRDKLLATQRRLQDLQQKITEVGRRGRGHVCVCM